MRIDDKLVEAAIAQAISRFPSGGGGAAAVYVANGNIIRSVCFDSRMKKLTCVMKLELPVRPIVWMCH